MTEQAWERVDNAAVRHCTKDPADSSIIAGWILETAAADGEHIRRN